VSDVRRHGSGGPFEELVGYSRVVRAGDFVFVSGCTSVADGEVVHAGEPAAQTRQAIENVRTALARVGGTLADVVRTRMFVTDIARDFDLIGRAHGELLAAVKPATSMLQVSALVDPRMLIEIEADAVLGAGRAVASERPRIVEASFEAESDLAAMLRSVDLPLPGASDQVAMLKAYLGGELVGCVGYGRYGASAVLHSLVVIREAKGEGVGRALVHSVIERLKKTGMRQIYLVTTDTARYFGYLGFSPVARETIAAEVLASSHLAQYGEGEATYMCYAVAQPG
jgi:enamine deaminase RidA (YjgF/YER057c/UK114 family)/N-acetylglutamate synthase-like GNAT family acetyltransferase